ncbi:MAG TPA: adenylate/guanylate cyclase domain-containing protein [Polyangiaceae bacterium]
MAGDSEALKVSEARLWRLIEERTKAGADVEAIDLRIWDLFGEEWAVMFTDLVGFSRQVERFGILHFLQIIHEHRKLLLPIVEGHDGLLIKEEGDSLLILFRRPERALTCAKQMQRACALYNERRKPEEQIVLCVGLGFGRVLRIGDSEVWGKEVNAASKLGEDTAKGNEILVTEAVKKAVDESDAGALFEAAGSGFAPNEHVYRVV